MSTDGNVTFEHLAAVETSLSWQRVCGLVDPANMGPIGPKCSRKGYFDKSCDPLRVQQRLILSSNAVLSIQPLIELVISAGYKTYPTNAPYNDAPKKTSDIGANGEIFEC